MCNQEIIEAKVEDFINSKQMFTSVDISNSIKKDGTWISNSRVASFLRKNASSLIFSKQYVSASIPVLNGQKSATLYLPIGSDSFDYQDRDQHALTPQEAGLDSNSAPATTVTPKPSNNTCSTASSIGKKIKISAKSSDRLRIPAIFVSEIGLNPGDLVDVDISSIKVDNPPIPKDLRVHEDGRISIPKSCINFNNQDEIYVYVENDCICFSKT